MARLFKETRTEVEHPPLDDGQWYACHFPERQSSHNFDKIWRKGCPACWIDLEATYHMYPNKQPFHMAKTKKRVAISNIEKTKEWWFST